MPVKKVQAGKQKSGLRKGKSQRGKLQQEKNLDLDFPAGLNKPSGNLKDAVIMLYGPKKVGKTSIASMFSSDMLHLMCEPMARELPIIQKSCPDYEHTKGMIEKLLTSKHPYDSVSIDPLPLFYQYAMDYCGRVHGFEHPTDENDYGKSWGLVYKDFSAPLLKLLHSNLGIMFHAHEAIEEGKDRDGEKYLRRIPDGSKQVREFVNANIENIWYMHTRGTKKFLQIRSDDYAFACTAFTDKFFNPDGEAIFAIPMGTSPAVGYKNLLKAFNNKQENTYSELEEKEVEDADSQKVERKSRVKRRAKRK